MGKIRLFDLREWLTLAEAAKYLSAICVESVSEADVLRLGLDGHLQLSVNFVNHTNARRCKVVSWDETDWHVFRLRDNYKSNSNISSDIPRESRPPPHKLMALFNALPENERPNYACGLMSHQIDDERYVDFPEKRVITLKGVWDLMMVGNEKHVIEDWYQMMTGGPRVKLGNMDGAFVENPDGTEVYQLQDREEKGYESGSEAHLEDLKSIIATCNTKGKADEMLLYFYMKSREKYLKKIESGDYSPDPPTYYPSEGLTEDVVIVVRTKALQEFVQSVSEVEEPVNDTPMPTSHANVSDKLVKMNQASMKFWSNANRTDRGTHPDNATIAKWLENNGFSSTLADKAATIIRPEWAPTGRKPEE